MVVDAALKHVEAALLAAEKKDCEQGHCGYGGSWEHPGVVSGVKQLAGKAPRVCARLYERFLFRVA